MNGNPIKTILASLLLAALGCDSETITKDPGPVSGEESLVQEGGEIAFEVPAPDVVLL